MVASQGSITQASESLHITPQTISGQINLLEKELDIQLFEKQGRGLQLTEAGKLVLEYAEQIFQLGDELNERLQQTDTELPTVLRIGVTDAVPKSIASRILSPAIKSASAIRVVCKENSQENLLAEMALHRLDFVLADGPLPSHLGIRGHSHQLGSSGMSFLAHSDLAATLKGNFPTHLDRAPLLIPSDVSQVHHPLMQWLREQKIRPNIIGEFDDSALMKAFGHDQAGIFIVPSAIAETVCEQYNVTVVGHTDEINESFFILTPQKRLNHEIIETIISEAQAWLSQL